MIDSWIHGVPFVTAADARGHFPRASCASYLQIGGEFSSKFLWGGPRPNSGGPRPNSGGARSGAGRPRKPPVSMMTDASDRWYVLRIAHGQMTIADAEARLAGFTVFAPTIFKPATPPRRDSTGIMRPGKPDRVEYLFVRYLLVRLNIADPDWHAIRDVPGVERVISSHFGLGGPGVPIAVPDAQIERVRALLDANGCLYPHGRRDKPIDKGVKVRLTTGPALDHAGICESSDGQRIEMLMNWFNRDNVPVRVSQSAVELV